METQDISVGEAGVVELPLSEKRWRSVTSGPMRPWHWIALGVVIALSAFLNFFELQRDGYGNGYYAATVRSMIQSWHNFFFVSLDPGGFVTADKPPLGLWIQAISAKVFGFSGVSILLPQALAGVISVILLYHLVRRRFGPIAGLIAALALALTPISVVMNRDNNLDTMLVVFLLLAAWCVIKAAETGKLRWLLLGAVMVGLGFNVKTLEAYLAVPALGLLYLLGAPGSWWRRIWHLALATLVLLVISLIWIEAVDLTPASERPYVGSSQTNSELDLAVGYNGVQRLLGGFGRGGGIRITQNPLINSTSNEDSTGTTDSTPQAPGGGNAPNPGGGGFGGGGAFSGGGAASPFRLLNATLGGQISWLLPLALIALIVLAWQARVRIPLNYEHQALVLWGVWLLTMAGFFSVASFFHPYYMVVMAPAICALVGIGLVLSWNAYSDLPTRDWRTWVLPASLVITAAVQIYLLASYQSWSSILTPIIAVLCLIAAVALVVTKLPLHLRFALPPVQRSVVVVALLTLLITPTIWSIYSIVQPPSEQIPSAGPQASVGGANGFPGGGSGRGGFGGRGFGGRDFNFERMRDFSRGGAGTGGGPGAGGNPGTGEGNTAAPRQGGGGFGGGNTVSINQTLVNYLNAHRGNTKYLFATDSAMTADPYIILTGEAVMPLGGFSGSDPILTTQKLATLVQNGTVHYFLLSSSQGARNALDDLPEQTREELEEAFGGSFPGGGGFGQSSSLTTWVQQHCSAVPASQWGGQSQSQQGGAGGFGGANQLYDCASAS
jgi:4-amino-4-deoxy-L-arabinose transferase-like glycosyltransferase